jgi:hypothetical protein
VSGVVTYTGDAVTAARMKGATPAQAEPLYYGWGHNPAALTAAKSDVAQFQEASEARATGVSSIAQLTVPGDTYQVVATQTSAAAQAIGEWALYDSATKPATTTVAAGSTVIGSATATGLNVAADTGFPGSGTCDVQIRGEVLKVTAGAGSTAWTVSRGQNGSTASAAIALGDQVTIGNLGAAGSPVAGATVYAHGDMPVLNLLLGDTLVHTIEITYS